ncbi:hypothetical protein DMA11_20470 [Marinilabiliaceae bacterium JC017]|nr:hypothetical protein DMA11_20470 [Marinilabiliaceae bacterium JC017]
MILWLCISTPLLAQSDLNYTGKVLQTDSDESIPFAYVTVNGGDWGTITNETGQFNLELPAGRYIINIACLGYEELHQEIEVTNKWETNTFHLKISSLKLPNIDVIAQQKSPVSSTTYISQNAIEHLQTNSVSDLLQLLPGNLHNQQAYLKKPTYASIRDVNTNYSSSLGTTILLDGMQMDNNATMQHFTLSTINIHEQRKHTPPASTGLGLDLRQLSTDNIASIEVIKGIPSVEYGGLTTGAIVITTKAGLSPWRARFKSTGNTRLASLEKGFLVRKKQGAMNINLDYAQNHADLRSPFDAYKRLSSGLSYSDLFFSRAKPLMFNARFRLYRSMDDNRTDPDTMKPEEVWSLEQKGASANIYGNWNISGKYISRIKYQFTAAYDQEQSYSKRYISSEIKALSLSREPGLNTGIFLPSEFIGEEWIDGLPVRYQGQISVNQIKKIASNGQHKLMAGVEYKHSQNKGDGKRYAPYPVDKTFIRPNKFSAIPAIRNLAFYAEESLKLPVKEATVYLTAGARWTNMQADGLFKSQLGWHLEPRLNSAITLLNQQHRHFSYLNLRAGIGQHYKAPPLAFLYPSPTYIDLVSLMHYSNNPEARTVLFTTYILTETPQLNPAANLKKEVGIDFTLYGIHTQLTFYKEVLKNGFATELDYTWLSNKKYDTSGVDAATKPDPEQLPFSTEYNLAARTVMNNKNKLKKTGMEYRIDFGHIRPIYTNILVDGAWKQTLNYYYINEFTPESVLSSQKKTIGLYQNQLNNTLKFSQFSSKLYLVTHVPQLRWVFSGSFQFIWNHKKINEYYYNQPKALQTADATIPFTEEMAQNQDYNLYIKEAKEDVDQYPLLFSTNLRLSKEIGDWFKLSVFVNNFLNYRPLYQNDSHNYIRRNNTSNFGAEIILRL